MRNIIIVQFKSAYKNKKGEYANLPPRMAKCTPDMQWALGCIKIDVEDRGGEFLLTDLFRSNQMQYQANLDYVNKKKRAYSPPAGGTVHEGARAFDAALKQLGMSLKDFWEICFAYGVVPIIARPDIKISECWHFEKRGSFQLIYDYYKAKKGNNLTPYRAMGVSMVAAIGLKPDKIKMREAHIQSGLIRLGYEIGNIDGIIGKRTKTVLENLGIREHLPIDVIYNAVDILLQEKYSEEYI